MGGTFLVKRAVLKTIIPTINLGTVNVTDVNFTLRNNSLEIATLFWEIGSQKGSVTVSPGQTSNNINVSNLNPDTNYEIISKARTAKTFSSNLVTKSFTTQPAFIQASGGSITDLEIGGVTYRYHAFTNTGNSTFSVSNLGTSGQIEYLIVAGGGSSDADVGGAGGAGGLLTNVTSSPLNINAQNYTITVGAGGAGADGSCSGNIFSYPSGQNGQNSSAFGLTAIGGGRGGNYNTNDGGNGGSGGGAGGGATSTYNQGGSGTSGQGFDGGDHSGDTSPHMSGGGGGAGGPGQPSVANTRGGAGGVGLDLSAYFPNWGTNSSNGLTGTRGWFAGGGGGGYAGSNVGAGGIGGGGDGKNRATCSRGNDGLPNTGGGGGGNAHPHYGRAGGGSGIVIIRYPI